MVVAEEQREGAQAFQRVRSSAGRVHFQMRADKHLVLRRVLTGFGETKDPTQQRQPALHAINLRQHSTTSDAGVSQSSRLVLEEVDAERQDGFCESQVCDMLRIESRSRWKSRFSVHSW